MSRLRVGTVRYLNARPLNQYLDPERFDVVADHPRAIARMLAEGEVDVALAPVAAVLTDADYRILPGYCIGADGPVGSVFLVAERPMEEWTHVLLDGVSRTSATLAQLLLQGPLGERIGRSVPCETVEPGAAVAQAKGTVAALVIGDEALRLPDRMTTRIDLSQAWKDWTGKPFVFAVWAARPGFPEAAARAIREAGDKGVAEIENNYQGDEAHYLGEQIRFPLDEPALIGLRRYAALAHQAGLLGTEHVQLLGPARQVPAEEPPVQDVLADLVEGGVPSAAGAQQLLRASFAELAAVAALRAESASALEGGYTYWVRPAVGAPLEGADAVAVPVPSGLSWHDYLASLREVRGGGLSADGPTVSQLVAWSETTGHPAEVLVQSLREAGAVSVTVDTPAALAAPVVAAAARLGLAAQGVVHVAPEDWSGFVALVHGWGALPGLTAVTVSLPLPEGSLVEPGEGTPARWLRAVALARLLLPTSVHVSASAATQGVEMSLLALQCGADDFGVVGPSSLPLAEDRQVFDVSLEAVERGLKVNGFAAERRTAAFQLAGEAVTRFRKIRPVAERAQL